LLIDIIGLFGESCLEELEACDCIDQIIVTNSAPVSDEQMAKTTKLTVLDVAGLLTEAVRRTYHGESMHHLYYQSYA
jgi:ribose-phosphate pyrophosphokinase